MKAQELRIGNWVVNVDEYWEVRHVDFNSMYIEKSCPFKPIPLTEEWLLKFGFEWDDIVTKTTGETEKMLYKNILLMQRHHATHWVAAPYGYLLSIHRTVYVHQLQNLYFALTGEELTIK
jgi:hypothetical protein